MHDSPYLFYMTVLQYIGVSLLFFHLKADTLMRVILIIRSASADQRRKKRESQRTDMDAVGKKKSPGRFEMTPSSGTNSNKTWPRSIYVVAVPCFRRDVSESIDIVFRNATVINCAGS